MIQPEQDQVGYGNLRWSSVRSCARKAIFESQGAPARERSRTEQGYLWRGRQLGRDFAIILAAEERRQGNPYRIKVASGIVGDWPRRWLTTNLDDAAFVVEQAVPWPLGIMHPDIHVLASDTLLEVLSSSHASEAMVSSKMLQLVGQMHYTGAQAGAVIVVDPSNPLDYDIYPIARTSPRYDELVETMTARIESVFAWRAGGTLPERVCVRPADARGHFCLYAEHCFAGWEPPDPDAVLQSPEAEVAAAELLLAKRDERLVKVEYDAALGRRRQAEQEFAQIVEDAGNPQVVRVAGVEVRRVTVSDRETLDLRKARTAGAWTERHDEVFAAFLKRGGAHVRWQVDRVDGEPLEDFGEVPF